MTATSYIWVTQILKLRMESASPYKGHTSRTNFARLPDPTSGLLRHTSGLPKILPWLRLPLLTMICLREYYTNDLDKATHLDLHLGGCVYIRRQFTTPRWGVTCFYQCLGYVLVVLNLRVPKNHHSMMTSSWEPQCHRDIIMKNPKNHGKTQVFLFWGVPN